MKIATLLDVQAASIEKKVMSQSAALPVPANHIPEDEPSAFFSKEKRLFGLDMIRATAILLVVVSHALYLIQHHASNVLGEQESFFHSIYVMNLVLGIYGVELFFVLSGFFIGRIIIKDVLGNPGAQSVKIFYLRRWFRTLPAYYIVLVSMIVFDTVAFGRTELHWPHFVFIQNFFRDQSFYAVSWSLSVEEWFYLLIPVGLTLLLIRGKETEEASKNTIDGKRFVSVVLGLILLITAMRIFYVAWMDPGYGLGVRKFVPVRFDSLLYGVLLAGLRVYYPATFRSLSRGFVCLAGFIALGLSAYWSYWIFLEDLSHSVFFRTGSFTIVSLAIAAILPYFERGGALISKISGHPFIGNATFYISLWSYSIYLTHFEVMRLLLHRAPTWGVFWIRMALSVPAVFLAGYLIYRIVEVPFMRYRDKHFPVGKPSAA
jgi:peptidoglycan/LPS O-acetylase OafA/YrhL